MKARKIVLLSLIVILLGVYIVQLVSTTQGTVEQYVLDGEPDKLVIESAANGTIILTNKDDGLWYLGENQQYETLGTEVNILVDALSNYTILQTVSKGGDEVLYGLDDENKITVTAYQDGEIISQFDVGKDASTARQSYIRVAGQKDILLVSDSFNNVFNITGDDVRIRNVYSYDPALITKANLITVDAGVLGMIRGDDGIWYGNTEPMTPEGIESWISTISILNAAGWLPDDWTPSVEAIGIIMFEVDGEIVQNAIFPVEGDENKFIGTSSVCPYAFYMSSYTKDKFLRTAEDFAE